MRNDGRRRNGGLSWRVFLHSLGLLLPLGQASSDLLLSLVTSMLQRQVTERSCRTGGLATGSNSDQICQVRFIGMPKYRSGASQISSNFEGLLHTNRDTSVSGGADQRVMQRPFQASSRLVNAFGAAQVRFDPKRKSGERNCPNRCLPIEFCCALRPSLYTSHHLRA